MLLDFMLQTNVSKKVQLNRVLSLEGVKVMIIWRCGVETPKKALDDLLEQPQTDVTLF